MNENKLHLILYIVVIILMIAMNILVFLYVVGSIYMLAKGDLLYAIITMPLTIVAIWTDYKFYEGHKSS